MANESAGVVYRHAVEAVLQRVLHHRKLLTPELAAELKALGVDVEKPRDVSLATWTALLKHCAKVVAPGLPEPDALTAVGHAVLDGYTETLVGKGALMLGRMLGPRRAMGKIAETWATANNIYTVTSTEKAPRHFEVTVSAGGDLRFYNRGILEASLQKVGAKDVKVELREAGAGTVYTVTWS